MPALTSMGVGLENVDDEALALFPEFPALRELTPIGVRDPGFRHVGRCTRLERLTCMYCRESGDEATAHIAGLQDSLLLRRADADHRSQPGDPRRHGVAGAGGALRVQRRDRRRPAVPRGAAALREVALDCLPGVTFAGTKVFPAGVRVRYST